MRIINLLILSFLTTTISADDNKDILKKVGALKYQTGTVTIGDNLATVKVPPNFKYLNPAQSQFVLEKVWKNPPDDSVLGMLILKNETPISDNFTYAVTISYSEEGHVKDDDAKEINYDELLEKMKADTKESNEYRKKEGYPTVDLIGWASAPFYDGNNKKLHWAKNVKFEDSEANTLNYNIRVLGRKGVLVLNIISDMDKLPNVKSTLNSIVESAEFTDGNKYSNFNPSVDKIAAYGIGGLIAGKVLAKAGLFVLLAKFWKIIAIGAVAGIGILKKFVFGRKDNNPTA